jgi:hypothetical protein
MSRGGAQTGTDCGCHVWAPCDKCGEGLMRPKGATPKRCVFTPGCEGHHVQTLPARTDDIEAHAALVLADAADLVDEVDRRARADGVSRAEVLGRIFAETVPRLFAEHLSRLPEQLDTLDAEPLDEPGETSPLSVSNAATERNER